MQFSQRDTFGGSRRRDRQIWYGECHVEPQQKISKQHILTLVISVFIHLISIEDFCVILLSANLDLEVSLWSSHFHVKRRFCSHIFFKNGSGVFEQIKSVNWGSLCIFHVQMWLGSTLTSPAENWVWKWNIRQPFGMKTNRQHLKSFISSLERECS